RHPGIASAAGKRFLSSVLSCRSKGWWRPGTGMRDEVTQHRFVLFDAAIVPIESIRSLVDDGVCARCLYEQWGAGAERVSPWLLADGPGVRELAQGMRASRTHAFGVSSLMSRVPMDELA